MIRLTVEEMNLLSIYRGKQSTAYGKYDALRCRSWTRICPFAERTLQKIPANRKRVCGACHFAAVEDRGKAVYAAAEPKSQQPCKKECCNCERGHCILLDDGE